MEDWHRPRLETSRGNGGGSNRILLLELGRLLVEGVACRRWVDETRN
jgi:hypothetical protein